MNTIRLCGGLGNQFFQYAFGREMKIRGIDVHYNLNWYASMKDPNRPYLLSKFNTVLDFTPSKEYQKVIREKELNLNLFNFEGFSFVGYWQSLLYFSSVVNILKKEFCLKTQYYTTDYETLKKDIEDTNSIALHVRRGDFLNTNRHYVQPYDYYKKALDFILSLKKDCKVFIFSDDLPWCKLHFKNVSFVELNDCCLEFEAMKSCKHFITSNSTYSWWAAFLGETSSTMVVTPKIWCVKEEEQRELDNKQLIPVNWIKL